MKKEYNFDKAKRGPVVTQKGKTRITIYLDEDIVNEFRKRADDLGYGYQTMINDALRDYIGKASRLVDENVLREVLREELKAVSFGK